MVVFATIIMTFACAYFCLTPSSNGIGVNGVPNASLTFADSMYFSVVTISSLGYGDMHPMGWSKLLVGIQVLFGLFFMGVMLAKLTSFRLAHHVSRLYGSELEKQLERFGGRLDNCMQPLSSAMLDLNDAFSETPGHSDLKERLPSQERLQLKLSKLSSCCSDLIDYVDSETERGGFFESAPVTTMARLAERIQPHLISLRQFIIGLPSGLMDHALTIKMRRDIAEIRAKVISLSKLVEVNGKNEKIKSSYSVLRSMGEDIPEGLFTRPVLLADREPPDQVLGKEDQPESENDFAQGDK